MEEPVFKIGDLVFDVGSKIYPRLIWKVTNVLKTYYPDPEGYRYMVQSVKSKLGFVAEKDEIVHLTPEQKMKYLLGVPIDE